MDLTELLEDEGIEYWTSGKNVARNCVNIQCPYCDDNSNHLGINYINLRVSCWRCGRHNITRLLTDLFDYPYPRAKQIVQSLGADSTPPLNVETSSVPPRGGNSTVLMPQESTIHFPKIHTEYLRSRGFPPRRTIRKYKLRAVYNLGEYKFRVVIPVYMRRRLVSFTARDITGQQDPPYKMASEYESIVARNQLVYNIDSIPIGGDAMLVEGPMDVMKLGDGAVCFFGVKHNIGQIVQLKRKKIRNLFIIFDNDGPGRNAAKLIAPIIAPVIKRRLEVVTLHRVPDPGALPVEDAMSLKLDLGFSI